MSIATRIVEIARAEIGVQEVPLGSNTGPRVREYQAATQLGGTGWPWCAAFIEWVWERAGLAEHPANPSTYWMCRIAAERGELSDTPQVGGAIIWCGTHAGLVVGIGSGVVFTVEGNSGDRVAERVRAIAGAKFVNPRGLGQATNEIIEQRLYWIEDPAARYTLRGPWKRQAWARRVFDRLPAATRRRARLLQTGDGRWVIRIGEPRRLGPWHRADHRDNALRRREAATGRRMRPYSTVVRNPAPAAEALGKTT